MDSVARCQRQKASWFPTFSLGCLIRVEINLKHTHKPDNMALQQKSLSWTAVRSDRIVAEDLKIPVGKLGNRNCNSVDLLHFLLSCSWSETLNHCSASLWPECSVFTCTVTYWSSRQWSHADTLTPVTSFLQLKRPFPSNRGCCSVGYEMQQSRGVQMKKEA